MIAACSVIIICYNFLSPLQPFLFACIHLNAAERGCYFSPAGHYHQNPEWLDKGGHWGSGTLIFTGLLDEQEGPWQNGIQLQKAYNRPMLRRRSCWKEQQGILYPWKGDIALHSKQKNDAGWEAWSGPLNCLRLRPPCKYLSLIDNASAKTRIFQA